MFSAKNLVRAIIMMALCLAFGTTLVMAQSTVSGAIAGVVTDQSGAVVPGAKVDIRNMDTNDTTSTTSDDAGRFRAVNLAPGNYEVKVNASGFSAFTASKLVVEVGRSTTVEAKLNVTGKGETIEVTGEAPVVNTERQDFANNINSEAIQNLPINGRRWSNYALLTPTGNPDGTFGLISFRGMSGILNNSTVDGGDNNNNFYGEERGRTRLSYSTSQDAIREFQVNTSNFSAEYGRAAGGAVNTVTKSGTNSMHGSGYWYIRDNELGATNPSTLLNGAPFKPEDRRQQFGATLGGPIKKDRAFFFFNYDQQKRNFPGDAIPRTGTNAYSATPYVVSDPAAAGLAPCPTNGTAFATTYSLGNAIFCRFGSVAAGQAASNAGAAFFTSLLGTNARKGEQLLFFPKVDVRVFGGNWATSYNWQNWTSPFGIQTQPTNTIAKDNFGDDLVRIRTLNSVFNRPIGGRASMELRFHWSTENLSGDFDQQLPGQPSVAGVTGSHTPGATITNWFDFGTQNYLPRPNNPLEDQFQEAGNVVISAGRHTFKLGGEMLHQHENVQSLFNAYGTYTYSGTFAYASYLADAYNAGANNFTGSGRKLCGTITGQGTAAQAGTLPCYASLSQGVGTLGYQFSTQEYSFFVNDDYKVHPRLNLSLGLRYELQEFPDPEFPNPALPATSNRPKDVNNFAPRTGFAWDILGTGKLVARGGYGLYYARVINSTIAAGLVNTGLATGQPSYTISPSTTSITYPNILTTATGLSVGSPNVVYWDNGFRTPFVHEADAIVEYEFMKNTVASVSYLNSMGRGLINFLDTNLPAYQGTNTFTRPDGSSFTIPTYGTAARPNAAFSQITKMSNAVDSDYNAVVVQVTRRMTNSWQLQSSYTYSKANDNGQNSQTFSTSNNAIDPNQPQKEYGRSLFDVPHKFVFTAIWQPNFFRNEKNVAHYVFDDWTLAPIVHLSSGFPFSGTISGNLPSTLAAGATTATANCATSHSSGISCAVGINRPFDVEKNAFRSPARDTVDYRMSRKFRITERTGVEFIAEAFNLFNHPNVSSMNTTQFNLGSASCTGNVANNNLSCALTSNATFNTPSTKDGGTNLRERQIQFAVRFSF